MTLPTSDHSYQSSPTSTRNACGVGRTAFATSRRRRRARASRDTPPIPWPRAVDLDFEREAQHDPDQHDDSQHGHALDRLVDNDRANDVGDDEHLEAEKDHPSEVLAQIAEGISTAAGDDLEPEPGERADPTNHQDRCSDCFDHVYNVREEVAVGHAVTLDPHCAARRRRARGRHCSNHSFEVAGRFARLEPSVVGGPRDGLRPMRPSTRALRIMAPATRFQAGDRHFRIPAWRSEDEAPRRLAGDPFAALHWLRSAEGADRPDSRW